MPWQEQVAAIDALPDLITRAKTATVADRAGVQQLPVLAGLPRIHASDTTPINARPESPSREKQVMANEISSKCPECGSDHVVRGRVKNPVPFQGGMATFVPDLPTKWYKLVMGVCVETQSFLFCRDCELLSTRMPKGEVEKYIDKKYKEPRS